MINWITMIFQGCHIVRTNGMSYIYNSFRLTIWIPPFEIQTSKSLVFKCFWFSNGRYSDPHCIIQGALNQWQKVKNWHFSFYSFSGDSNLDSRHIWIFLVKRQDPFKMGDRQCNPLNIPKYLENSSRMEPINGYTAGNAPKCWDTKNAGWYVWPNPEGRIWQNREAGKLTVRLNHKA